MDTYDFEVVKGDTWDGVTFTILVNGAPLNLAGAHILCQFKTAPTSDPLLTFSDVPDEDNVGGGIVFPAPLTGEFTIEPTIINLPAGKYVFDIQFTLASGVVKTYIRGTMTVVQDVSYAS